MLQVFIEKKIILFAKPQGVLKHEVHWKYIPYKQTTVMLQIVTWNKKSWLQR